MSKRAGLVYHVLIYGCRITLTNTASRSRGRAPYHRRIHEHQAHHVWWDLRIQYIRAVSYGAFLVLQRGRYDDCTMKNNTSPYNFTEEPSSTTWFTNVPTPPPINEQSKSPCFMYTDGFLVKPTPFGVPVMMMEPGSSVVPCESVEMVFRILKIWSLGSTNIRDLPWHAGAVL